MLRGFEDSIPLYSGGLYVAGEKLQVTKADDQSIYAQQVRHFNDAPS
jgi:profilin